MIFFKTVIVLNKKNKSDLLKYILDTEPNHHKNLLKNIIIICKIVAHSIQQLL